ncbi:MAG: transposase [Clostridia bacterium]|nr:transposase [Clostridia bacterium]
MARKEDIRNLTLILMYLTSWEETEYDEKWRRSWKGYDFDVINELEEEGMLHKGSHKSKSVHISRKGVEKAKQLLEILKLESDEA